MTISLENGNQFSFIAQILKVYTNQRISEIKSKLLDGDDSSDSEGLYEDPTTGNEKIPEENGNQNFSHQVYCVELRKKTGPMADYLEFFRRFKYECFKLNNADNADAEGNKMEGQSGF